LGTVGATTRGTVGTELGAGKAGVIEGTSLGTSLGPSLAADCPETPKMARTSAKRKSRGGKRRRFFMVKVSASTEIRNNGK